MIARGKKIILTNEYHNTEVGVIPLTTGYLSPRQASRVERELCGQRGCTCGTDGIGMRGGEFVADQDRDGSAMIFRR